MSHLKAESGNNIVAQRVKPAAAFTTPTTRRAALIQVLAAFLQIQLPAVVCRKAVSPWHPCERLDGVPAM